MFDTTQRARIVDALSTQGWELVGAEDGDWWVDEIVVLRSSWSPQGAPVVLTFLVDPQHDGPRRNGESVWAVVATRERLIDRGGIGSAGPFLSLGRGWEAHLGRFVEAIAAMRA